MITPKQALFESLASYVRDLRGYHDKITNELFKMGIDCDDIIASFDELLTGCHKLKSVIEFGAEPFEVVLYDFRNLWEQINEHYSLLSEAAKHADF